MTTSLANFVLAHHDCELLVPGIKEPWLFSRDPAAAAKYLDGRIAADSQPRAYLDASTSYSVAIDALRAIRATGVDYRVMLCLRNQFDRLVSAYKYYRALLTIPLEELDRGPAEPEALAALGRRPRLKDSFLRTVARCYFRAFGRLPHELTGPDLGLWMADEARAAPAHWLAPAAGRYFGTANVIAAVGGAAVSPAMAADIDRECELLARQSLSQRVLHEMRYMKAHGRGPWISILSISFYAPIVRALLSAVDPRNVLLLSMEDAVRNAGLAGAIAGFAGCGLRDPAARARFPSSNDTALQAPLVGSGDLQRAELLLGEGLRADSAQVGEAVNGCPGLDLTQFNTQALYH